MKANYIIAFIFSCGRRVDEREFCHAPLNKNKDVYANFLEPRCNAYSN